MKKALSILPWLYAAILAAAPPTPLALLSNAKDGIYQSGETIEITAQIPFAQNEAIAASIISLKVVKNNTETILEKQVPVSGDSVMLYEASFDEACSIIVEATLGENKATIGAIVAPETISPGTDRPRNFDTYWASRIESASNLPFEIEESSIDLGDSEIGFEAYDVEIDSPGPRPARGILAKPANAAKKSLPIVLVVRAAGVKGDWCRAHLDQALGLAKKGQGALSFDLNAHGMLNHEPEKYYEELENGLLNEYWNIGVESRDDYYFGYMYLRMLRSIEYLTRQPEWDGKRILVVGESQGGGQAFAAAGLDPRVSAVVATVPAMCDFGGPLSNRKGGWPQPIDSRPDNENARATVAYFDAAHLLKGSKATIVVEIGLIDETCPSTSIFAAINQAEGEKIIHTVPYRAHPWPKGPDREIWDATIFHAKNAFIDDYLK